MQAIRPGGPREPRPWGPHPLQPYPDVSGIEGAWPCEGCNGDKRAYWHRCPRSMSSPEGQRAVKFWAARERGIPPCSGGEGQQTQRGSELIAIVGLELDAIQQEQIEKNKPRD